MEAIAERPDGIRVPFVPFPSPIFDIAGRLIGGVNLLVDISERKRAELNNQRLIAIIEGSDDAIISKDLNGIVTSWNRGAQHIFGYSADEMVGEPITRIIPSDRLDEEQMILARLVKGEKIDHYETVRRRKDGSLINISLTVSPLVASDGRVVGASKIARDITVQRKLRGQQELLLREMRHRMKNVIAIVQAIAGQTLESAAEDEKRAFASRLEALAHATTLSGKSWDAPKIRVLIEETIAPFSSTFAARLRTDGPDEPTVDFMGAVSLSLALYELATNCVKHGAWSKPAGDVAITWSDTGDGAVRLEWTEAASQTEHTEPLGNGFGIKLLERLALIEDGTPQLERHPEGMRFVMMVKRPSTETDE
jgi:PAS domain S-box-containing protein